MEEPGYDKVTQASLNGIYVKAQEMDRGHNGVPAPSFAPPGARGDVETHASTHASDEETHASARASDAEAHATTRASDIEACASANGVESDAAMGDVESGADVGDVEAHASTHASDG